MKTKCAIISIVLLWSVGVYGQVDTIPMSYPYYYPMIEIPPIEHYDLQTPVAGLDDLVCHGSSPYSPVRNYLECDNSGLGFVSIAARHVADRPLVVLGLACCVYKRSPLEAEYAFGYNYFDAQVELSYAAGDSLSHVASAPIAGNGSPGFDNVSKQMRIDLGYLLDSLPVAYIYENFFDTPVTIAQGDTFYLSSSAMVMTANDEIFKMCFVHTSIWEWHTPQDYSVYHWPDRGRRGKMLNGEWRDDEDHDIDLIWLIIKREEDTCRVPQLYCERLDERVAFVRWDNSEGHAACELSIGPAGIAPEDGTIVQNTLPQYVFANLDPDSHYTVYARARCDFARTEWTEWSSPLDIYLASYDVGTVTGSPRFEVYPNPAHGTFIVEIVSLPAEFTLCDQQGRTVYTTTLQAGKTSVGTAGLPHGVYQATLTSAEGIATRRVVVD